MGLLSANDESPFIFRLLKSNPHLPRVIHSRRPFIQIVALLAAPGARELKRSRRPMIPAEKDG